MDNPTPISGFNTYSQARVVYWQSDRFVHGPFPGNLAALQGLSPADRNIIVGNGTTWTVRNGQLPFPATQNPSADPNTLDDYEEGTWTPSFTFATPGNLSRTFSIQNGWYAKIGQLVVASFDMVTSSFTWTTASGAIQLTGFPFTNLSQIAWGPIHVGGLSAGNYTYAQAFLGGSSTTGGIVIVGIGSPAGAATQPVAANFASGGTVQLRGNIAYRSS